MPTPDNEGRAAEEARAFFEAQLRHAVAKVHSGEWALGVIPTDGQPALEHDAIREYRRYTPYELGTPAGVATIRVGGQPGIAIISEGHLLVINETPRGKRCFIELFDERGPIYEDEQATRVFRGSIVEPFPCAMDQFGDRLQPELQRWLGVGSFAPAKRQPRGRRS